MSPRRRQVVDLLTAALAGVAGGWLLPRSPAWAAITFAIALFALFGFVWWRLRNK